MREATAAASSPASGPQRVPIRGARRMIAERMAASHTEIPGVHVVEEVDVTDVDLSRVVAITAAAIASLAPRWAYFNAHVIGDEILLFEECNVAIAVDTPRGLMVPVVSSCGGRDVADIHAEVQRLAQLARTGKLAGSDVAGATVTVTSPGKRGGVLATPLINPPQTTIVGIHRAVERVVPHQGRPAIRTIANLTVTFDHRVIDGAAAGSYAIALGQLISRSAATDPAPALT